MFVPRNRRVFTFVARFASPSPSWAFFYPRLGALVLAFRITHRVVCRACVSPPRGGKEIEREKGDGGGSGGEGEGSWAETRRGGGGKGRGPHLKSTIEIQDPYAKSLARTDEGRREEEGEGWSGWREKEEEAKGEGKL